MPTPASAHPLGDTSGRNLKAAIWKALRGVRGRLWRSVGEPVTCSRKRITRNKQKKSENQTTSDGEKQRSFYQTLTQLWETFKNGKA